ncbi:MAG: LysR family transcriptional regulator [Ramlibacter sp.]
MNLLASMRYLLALSEHQHFARAADACHITQGGLSNAIRSLEEEFKVTIVRRDRSYLGLTPEGEKVLATAQRMLREHDLLVEQLDEDADRPRGPLRIGAVPTAMPVLALFAATLKAQYAGIVPVALSMSSPELEDGLNSLSLDLALGYTDRISLVGNDLTALSQYTERYFLLRRSSSPLATPLLIGEPVTWKDSARKPMALLVRGMHNRAIVDGAFASVGAPIKPEFETNSILTLALSVRSGTVCSVMPGGLVAAIRDHVGLEACPLVEPDVHTSIGFMARASVKATRVTQAALRFAATPKWRALVTANTGLLQVA